MTSENSEVRAAKRRKFDWNLFTAALSAIGLILAAGGLFYTATQIKLSRQIARSEFMRECFQSMQQYNDIQSKLVEGGEWRNGIDAGPKSQEEWFRLQRYMGLLEQVYQNYLDEILDIDRIDSSYSHRVKAIATHPLIRKRLLEDQAYRWGDFIKLTHLLKDMPLYKKHAYTHPSQGDWQPAAKIPEK